MPTSVEQVQTIKRIVEDYLPDDKACDLFGRLRDEVGRKSDNKSVALSLDMLAVIYKVKDPVKMYGELQQIYASYETADT